MLKTKDWDVVVIKNGPAGLPASVSAHDRGARVAVVERESRSGGYTEAVYTRRIRPHPV